MRHLSNALFLATLTLAACSSSKSTNSDTGTTTTSTTSTTNTTTNQDTGSTTADSSCQATGSASVTGTFLPEGATTAASLDAQDAIFIDDATSPVIFIPDFPCICASLTANANNVKANSSGLDFNFTKAVAVGDYNAPTDVDVQYAQYDSTCNSPYGESSASGTVTISSVDASGVHGTFNLVMGTSDNITGTFDAATCAATGSGTGTNCVQ